MARGVVSAHGVIVLRAERVKRAREFAEVCLGLADAEVAGLLEGGKGVVYAGDGEFVGLDVEVCNCVLDKLAGVSFDVISSYVSGIGGVTDRRGIFFEEHFRR